MVLSGCNGEALRINEHKEDKVLTKLEKMMDKLNGLEEKLHQKADVKAVEDLECRVKQLEDSAKERVSNESRIQQIQHRFTKMMKNMEGKSHKDRLRYLGLWTPEIRS